MGKERNGEYIGPECNMGIGRKGSVEEELVVWEYMEKEVS